MSHEPANADLIADYLGEANDYIEQLNRILLVMADLDGEWPKDQVNEMFRSAHSLKGLSACFGFERTNTVTHQLESMLTAVRDGKLVASTAIVRCMFDAIDLVQHLTGEIAGMGHEHADIALVLDNLIKVVAGDHGEPGTERSAEKGRRGQDAGGKPAANQGGADNNETVRVRMERLDRMVNLTGELVVARSRFQLVSRQMRPLQRVAELSAVCHEASRRIEELDALRGAKQIDAASLGAIVDALQEQFQQLQNGHRELGGLGRVLRDLDDVAYDFDGVVSGIHEAVLQLRMVPLESVFRRLQRVVRDTAEVVKKPVDFVVSGGETQIDKRVADEIVNPLVHMLRNSVDHGLEDAATRQRAGKNVRGKVEVESYQRGSSVIIEVRDDGGGIDPQRVLKKAVESGILTPEEAAAMGPREAQRLIFAPGFSTSKVVTEVSGRGMGMDIIAESIKKLRGTVELSSEVGVGTRFTVQLPPSMSILASLLIEVRGTMFALPLTEVREIVELTPGRVQRVQMRRMIVVRERPMPLVMLPDTYRFHNARVEVAAATAEPQHAIVFGQEGDEVALGVDRLVGKEDLVIKPLCPELAAVRGLAGMAIRGDGKVTLILDPSTLASFAMSRHQSPVLAG